MDQTVMGQSLAGLGLKLDDIGRGLRIDALDQDQILADLRVAGVPAPQCDWLSVHPLNAFDRVLIARDARHGRCEGLMLVRRHVFEQEAFLVIEALSGTPAVRGEAVLQRMLAFLILRLGTLDAPPAAILARTRNQMLCRVLHRIAGNVRAVAFYPEPDGRVIPLRVAALAHRFAHLAGINARFDATRLVLGRTSDVAVDGPLLAMLDLRQGNEAALVDDARTLFRARLPRAANRSDVADAMPVARIAVR